MYCLECFCSDWEYSKSFVRVACRVERNIVIKEICEDCFENCDALISLTINLGCLCGSNKIIVNEHKWCFYSTSPYRIVYLCCSELCRNNVVKDLKNIDCNSLVLESPIKLTEIL